MTQSEEYGLRPGVGVFALFPHMNYRPWFAMAEFVDNSLDSYLRDRQKISELDHDSDRLRVVMDVVTSGDGEIRIWDNAGGIRGTDIERAFTAAEPPPDAAGLSQFGVGMKSAGAWWARVLEVRTTAIGESVERTIRLDFDKIVEEQRESFVATTREVSPSEHYTEVRLHGLLKTPQTRTIDKIARHLASIYRVFIREGTLELTFMDDTLGYDEPDVLQTPHYRDPESDPIRWRKDIAFTLLDGREVRGHAGILSTGSRSRAGFALFRKKRLVLGSAEDSWRPKDIFGHTNTFRYQRVFGELHLDDFDVAHTKDGFLWEDVEEELLEKLRDVLDGSPKPLLAQAEGFRVRQQTEDLRAGAQHALDSTASVIENRAPEVMSDHVTAPLANVSGESIDDEVSHLASRRELTVVVSGVPWTIVIDITNDPSATDWLKIVREPDPSTDESEHFHIRMSLATDFMERFGGQTAEELEPIIRLAAGLALAEITARRSGIRHTWEIRRRLNDLLRRSLAAPS